MNVNIEKTWKTQLKDEFEKEYFKTLSTFVKSEYSQFKCFPDGKDIFAAFDACPFNDVKVVIIGQDPYHDDGQAHGLCFSVPEGVKQPPSLVNIYKELQDDLGMEIPVSGNLSHWASQGVLLLNATLTVRAHQAGSHQKKGWEKFTDAIIQKLSENREGVVFLLWGGYAKQKGKRIDAQKHVVFTSGHPSPLSANRGYWFGNKHFSKVNEYLKTKGEQPVQW